MKLKEFIKARDKRMSSAERQMTRKVLYALNETLQPLYDAARNDQLRGYDPIFSDRPIKKTLKWLYVDWAYNFGKWFISNYDLNKDYDYFQETLEALFEKQGAEMVQPILGLTKERAKAAIKDALTAANRGASIDEVTALIKTHVEGQGGAMSMGRAQTIARTEVISASNQASFESVKTTGLQLEKKWLTGGINIRDTHMAAQGQGWIPRDDAFRVGGHSAHYPGETSLPVEERANCKCVLIYRVIS